MKYLASAVVHPKWDHTTHKIHITLIFRTEDNINIIYSPELEIYGYGDTEEEALEFFNVYLEETLEYKRENGTLEQWVNTFKNKRIYTTSSLSVYNKQRLIETDDELVHG